MVTWWDNSPAKRLVGDCLIPSKPQGQLQSLHHCVTSCSNSKPPAAPGAGLHTPPYTPCTPGHASLPPLLCCGPAVHAVVGLSWLWPPAVRPRLLNFVCLMHVLLPPAYGRIRSDAQRPLTQAILFYSVLHVFACCHPLLCHLQFVLAAVSMCK